MTSLAPDAAGLALVIAIALLCVRRIGTALLLTICQAVVVAVAAAAQHQALAAVAAFTIGAVALPATVRPLLDRLGFPRDSAPIGGTVLAVLAGTALAILSAPIGGIGVAFAIVLLGILLTATRREPLMQGLGLVGMQNGLALAAAGIPAMPWPVRLAAVLPVLPALFFAGIWFFPKRPRTAS